MVTNFTPFKAVEERGKVARCDGFGKVERFGG